MLTVCARLPTPAARVPSAAARPTARTVLHASRPTPAARWQAAANTQRGKEGDLPPAFITRLMMSFGLSPTRPLFVDQRFIRRAMLATLPRMHNDKDLGVTLMVWGMCIQRAGWDPDPEVDSHLRAEFERQLLSRLPGMETNSARDCMLGWATAGYPLSPPLEAAMRAAVLRMLRPEAAQADPLAVARGLFEWYQLGRPLDDEMRAAARTALLLALPQLDSVGLMALQDVVANGRGWDPGPEVEEALRKAGLRAGLLFY